MLYNKLLDNDYTSLCMPRMDLNSVYAVLFNTSDKVFVLTCVHTLYAESVDLMSVESVLDLIDSFYGATKNLPEKDLIPQL